MSEDSEKSRISIERHLQTLIVVIIVGLLGWVGTTVQETQVAVAKLTVELEFLKKEIQAPTRKFETIETRLDSIERKLGIHMGDELNHKGEK